MLLLVMTMLMTVRRRGLVIAGIGTVMFVISFLVAGSILDSGFSGPMGFDAEYLFDGMFDEITDEIMVPAGGDISVPYEVGSGVERAIVSDNGAKDGSVIMWTVHILDPVPSDSLSVTASGSDGTPYGMHPMRNEMNFGVAENVDSGLLELEISNTGSDPVYVIVMFSENPEDSELFTDPDSPLNAVVLPLATAGIMAFVGIIITIVGIAIFAVDVRRQRGQQYRQGRIGRFDDWPDGR